MSTITDVAQEAGVSPMTVSRYYNQPSLLHPATLQRVKTAVERLQYVPNQAARSLVQGRTKTIGFIIADITNPYFTTLARGAEDVAHERGYTLMLCNSDETIEKERRYIDVLISQRVDGVVLSLSEGGEHHLELLRRRDIPVVLLDRKVPGVQLPVIRGDSYEAGRMLVEHLVQEGYRHIAFVGGPAGVSSLEDRLRGYRTAMAAHGLAPDVHLGRYDIRSGEEIIHALLERTRPPEAFIAANNMVAVGVLQALRLHRLQVPRDVGLACFDEPGHASIINPFLTVAAQPAYQMGRMAMEKLLLQLEAGTAAAEEHVLPFQLKVRRSTLRRNPVEQDAFE